MTNADLAHEILISLRRIIRTIDLHSRYLARRYDLTGPQLVALQTIAAEGEISGSELAAAVSLSHATISGIVQRLEERGFVQRQRSESDRRRVWLLPTEAAEELLREAPPLLQQNFLGRLERLEGWERTQILASLQRLVAMMEGDEVDAGAILTTEEFEPSELVVPDDEPT